MQAKGIKCVSHPLKGIDLPMHDLEILLQFTAAALLQTLAQALDLQTCKLRVRPGRA